MALLEHQATRAGRKEWIGLGVLALPLLLVSMDVSVLYFTVPFISRDLAPSATEQLWIFDIYGFVLAGLLITMGSLGDRIGRRRLLLIGALAFGAASALAAYSGSAAMLIAARAVLGIGGATLMPSTLGLIRTMFADAKQRSTAIAVWTGVMTGGIALGPVLSGLLIQHFWWGSVFLINIPAMLLLLVLGPVLLPEHRNPAGGRFDLLSSLLSIATVLPVIWGIKEIAAHGVGPARIGAIALGLAIGFLFVRRQHHHDRPMIDLGLLRRKAFTASVVVTMLSTLALVGFAIFTTQYLQLVLGMSPLQGALWSLLPSVAVGAAAPIAARLAQRGVDRGLLITAGFVIAAAGFAILGFVRADSLWTLMAGAGIYAAGLVVVMSLATEIVMAEVEPEKAGASSAIVETASELGGALGIALLGSLGAAVYRSHLGAGVPAAARETLAGALSQTDGAVAATIQHAFVTSLDVVAVAALIVMLLAAAFAARTLRRG